MVSLGTGMDPVTELKEIDVFRPENLWDTAKLAYGLSTIGNYYIIVIICPFMSSAHITCELQFR